MRHFRSIGVISITIALLCAGGIDAHADMSEVCDNLEEAGDDQVTLSVKYQSVEARDAVWSVMNPVMHLDFISRVIGDVSADDALAFCRRIDVAHMELIASKTKDVTLHRLLEIYRVYTYVLGGRFSVAAFNFSQGVRNQSLGKGESGERTISEALDVVANRIAPVFVAAGNSPEIGLSPYAGGGAVLPVVATEAGGSAIFARSSRPSVADGPNRLFLFADGAPRPQASSVDGIDHPACNTSEHLTLGQLLLPEVSQINQGGSSFATFSASASACYVHQYLNVMETYLSAEKAVGTVSVQPFVAYYVDNPINAKCPALKYRLADEREKYEPRYQISVKQKQRMQDFFFGETIEFNLRYSAPVLKAFYSSLPSVNLANGFSGQQRYINSKSLVTALKKMTFGDWVQIGANKRSQYYSRWLRKAAEDTNPVLENSTINDIINYCQNYSLYIVLSDDAKSEY